MTDEKGSSPGPEEDAADFRWAAGILEERLTHLSDRCRETLGVSWDRCRLPHPSENFCLAMVEEWRILMDGFCGDLPKLLAELNRVLNSGPGEARRIEIESACRSIADAFEPLVSLSERWSDYRLIRRWRMVFLELTETNFCILEQVCALPEKIRESLADRASGPGRIEVTLKLVSPPNFPPSRIAARALVQASPPPIRRRQDLRNDGGCLSIAISFIVVSFFLWPWFLIVFLAFWPFLALAVIVWVWLMLLGAAGGAIVQFNVAPGTMATLEKVAVAISLVLLLVFVVWAGLKIDHLLVQ